MGNWNFLCGNVVGGLIGLSAPSLCKESTDTDTIYITSVLNTSLFIVLKLAAGKTRNTRH